jgi:glycosyltransferase involved in cell wall biosynthesis
MIYLAYIVVAFAVVQLLIAWTNLLFRQRLSNAKALGNELVSVLIPARNEEKNISHILSDLINQDYQNIEIFVFNDQSTDKTALIVSEYAKQDNRIKLINSDGLPNEWLGKNHACNSLSNHATGNYLLFLDSDVRIGDNIISNTVGYLKKHKLGLLSIFPKQIMVTIGELITIPNMNYILLTLLPLILVRKSKFASISAANGQFMLFDSKIYSQIKPHELMKASRVEDIVIARYYKQNKIAVACLTGNDSIKCRMYDGFSSALNGFSKNVTAFFGNSYLAASLFWIITTLGLLLVYFCFSTSIFFVFAAIIIATRVSVSIVSQQNIILNLLLMIPQQLVLALFICKALINDTKKQQQWKGRNIS